MSPRRQVQSSWFCDNKANLLDLQTQFSKSEKLPHFVPTPIRHQRFSGSARCTQESPRTSSAQLSLPPGSQRAPGPHRRLWQPFLLGLWSPGSVLTLPNCQILPWWETPTLILTLPSPPGESCFVLECFSFLLPSLPVTVGVFYLLCSVFSRAGFSVGGLSDSDGLGESPAPLLP